MNLPYLAITVGTAAAIAAGTALADGTTLKQPAAAKPAVAEQANVKADLKQPDALKAAGYDCDCEETDVCGNEPYCSDACDPCGRDALCGWDFGGWIEQGYTLNGYDPDDHFNGVVGLNDRANEYQMNQLWLYAAREADTGGCGLDYGGRVDVVYGTDGEFFQMEDGLEARWDQEELYQVALLRFYLDVAWNDWTVRMGRWDAPVGYEPYEATESFFYSRSYTFMTQPGSLFGVMLTRELNEQLSISSGIHRGSDQFDDMDGQDSLNYVGGGSWESCDGDTWLDAYVIAEEEGPTDHTLHYSVVGGTMLTNCLEYVCEWYNGEYWDTDAQVENGEWYGLNQHLMYTFNRCWAGGMRFEWFRDDDGVIVHGFRERNPAQGPYVGDFYELTFALNYTPCDNFALRPEIRWDWYKSDAGGPEPFDDETRSNQFIASIDAVWAF